jgi:hypothetical protein
VFVTEKIKMERGIYIHVERLCDRFLIGDFGNDGEGVGQE